MNAHETYLPLKPVSRLAWVDTIRVIALIWIVLNHVSEQLFGFPYIGNPTFDWPALGERLQQLVPLSGYGWGNVPVNILRYVGWLGDQGVGLFLILSGFGLTWGSLSRDATTSISLRRFWTGRGRRIFPLWWGAHIALLILGIFAGLGASPTSIDFYLSFFGIRLTPTTFYYLSPAWWYIGLLLQLYAIFPLLWKALQNKGPIWMIISASLVGYVSRAAGVTLMGSFIDPWLRGAYFVTRLSEFVVGMALAYWLFTKPAETEAILTSKRTRWIAGLGYLLGLILSLFLPGMIVAPSMLSVAGFFLLYAIFRAEKYQWKLGSKLKSWINQHTYSLFLVHHPILIILIPLGTQITRSLILPLLFALGGIAVSAVGLEKIVGIVQGVLSNWFFKNGWSGLALRVALSIGAIALVLLAAEITVRSLDPQEVLGWGERVSLEPSDTFGWTMKPSTKIELRWQGYDYTVYTNSLGFQGPKYGIQKPEEAVRILVVGDAFTSAEGVDTDQSWPRVLVSELERELGGAYVEVMNFAVTGYGPNQYAAILMEYVPLFHPDIILIGFYINDFEDVQISDDEFHASIGFQNRNPNSIVSILSLQNLRKYLKVKLLEPLKSVLRQTPNPTGYFLGSFRLFDRSKMVGMLEGAYLVEERMSEIKQLANEESSRLVVVEIPASIQVCSPDALHYFPDHVDLNDSNRFDMNQPHRLLQSITGNLALDTFDLTPGLRQAASGCPYQPENMHWTIEGQRIAATEVAGYLISTQDMIVPAIQE